MSPLTLYSASSTITIPSSFLLVGIDETGHEDLSDPNNPLFGLGGCVVPVRAYGHLIRDPWLALRRDVIPTPGPFHAADLRQPRPDQVDGRCDNYPDTGGFFRSNAFGRLAVVLTNRATLTPPLPPYQIVARALIERIARLTVRFGCDGVALIVEESDRTDRLAAAFIEGYDLQRATPQGPQRFDFRKFRMPKAAAEPLLEVADLVAHVAGAQVRTSERIGSWANRRDFAAVFSEASAGLAEFFNITQAQFTDGAP